MSRGAAGDSLAAGLLVPARRPVPASRSKTTVLQAPTDFESYGFAGEESRVHFEYRAQRTPQEKLQSVIATEAGTIVVGILCGLIAAGTNISSVHIHSAIMGLVNRAMWEADDSGTPRLDHAFAMYLATNAALVLAAALLTCWAPHAALSGLPKLKSYLNGTDIGDNFLGWRTFIAKTIGITLAVSTNLPLGKEGPMVHIGAMVAHLTSRRLPWLRSIPEINLPAPQREWVGMGAAAGVAAAFNAPFGGILYSFEEVCSHWSALLTWRSFQCAVVMSLTYALCVDIANGELTAGYDIKHEDDAEYPLWEGAFLAWLVLLAVAGGLMGSLFTVCVVRFRRWRKKMYRGRRSIMTIEALAVTVICFCLSFWTPSAFGCEPCPVPGAHNSSSSLELEAGGTSFSCTHAHRLVRYDCPEGHHNPLASLLLTGQDGLVELLLARNSQTTFSIGVLAAFLSVYYVLACTSFGVFLPAGNFVPGIIIGGAGGRMVGEVLKVYDLHAGWDPGAYAVLGAAAVLSGMTRMTLTLAAILTELAKDVRMLPAIMLSLAVARIAGSLLSNSFDEEMMEVDHLPCLVDAPPEGLTMLTARDTMSEPVVTLTEKVTVRLLLNLLETCSHNGFPIVRVERLHADDEAISVLCGMIWRRQLEQLLSDRVWTKTSRRFSKRDLQRFVSAGALDDGGMARTGSLMTDFYVEREQSVASMRVRLLNDLDELIDLRTYMDPSPFTVTELMPLSRVYRMFNEIGVRNLPVLNGKHNLVGIITRKNLQVHTIEESILEHCKSLFRSIGSFSTLPPNVQSNDAETSRDSSGEDAVEDVAVQYQRIVERYGLANPKLRSSAQDLCQAAVDGKVDQLLLLVKQGLRIDQGDYDKRTALHLAASEGLLGVIKALVDELGASLSVVDRWGGTPLDDAIRSGHQDVTDFLKSRGATRGHGANADPSAALCNAAARGDIDQLRLLVSQGLRIDQGDYDKRTALHLAASEGLLPVVTALVDELGASLSLVDRWGGTPLDDAIRSGHQEVFSFLKSRGATRGHGAKADPSAALCNAAAHGDIDQLHLLVSQGLRIDQGDYDKRTALHLAASEGLLKVVMVLVDELGAGLSRVDRWGGTPLDDAIRSGHQDVADFLKSRGATRGHGANADPSAALCNAAARGDIDQLRLLVSQGLRIDQGDYDKRTALHLAASEGLLPVVTALVDELGASLSLVDRWGGTPLDDAIRSGHQEVAEFLKARGATQGRV